MPCRFPVFPGVVDALVKVTWRGRVNTWRGRVNAFGGTDESLRLYTTTVASIDLCRLDVRLCQAIPPAICRSAVPSGASTIKV